MLRNSDENQALRPILDFLVVLGTREQYNLEVSSVLMPARTVKRNMHLKIRSDISTAGDPLNTLSKK